MRHADDERFIDLDRPERGRRAPRRWTGTPSQRGRAARRLPPAVFKISSYSHSGGAVVGRFEYITREGEVEAEGPGGELLDQAALADRAAAWSEEAEARHTRRVSMSAVLSFPADVDEEKATEAARQVFREAFADNHDYVFAGHRDTKNFHVHVVVQSAGLDGKQLRIGRADLQDLRLLFAEQAAEQGIELDASPRWARGEEQVRQPGRKIEGMMRRWGNPERALDGAWFLSAQHRTQLDALVDVRRDRDPEAAVSPLEYARAALHLVEQAGEAEQNAEQVERMKAAIQLARFGGQQGRDPNCPPAEAAAVAQVVAEVDKALTTQISELREDPEAWRAALAARRPLAAELAASRPAPERKWAREADAPREPGQEVGAQALEYARAARWAVAQSAALPTDADRVAAVKGAVDMARFGWEISAKETCPEVERATAREIIDHTEREIREAIAGIEDPEAQRAAIQARARLYRAGVQEYRAERQEQAQRERAATRRQEDPEYERPGSRSESRVSQGVGGRAASREAEQRGGGRDRAAPDRGMGQGDTEMDGGGGPPASPSRGSGRARGTPGPAVGVADPASRGGERAVVAGLEPERVEGAARARDPERTRDDGLLRVRPARSGAGAAGAGPRVVRGGVVEEGDRSAAGGDSEPGRRAAGVEQERDAAWAEVAGLIATMREEREQAEQVQERRREQERAREQERERRRARARERDEGLER